jgi:hypothetical protein
MYERNAEPTRLAAADPLPPGAAGPDTNPKQLDDLYQLLGQHRCQAVKRAHQP